MILSVSRPSFATDAQWNNVRDLPDLVYVAEFLVADNLQVWYRRAGVLRVRSVNTAGRKVHDRKSQI